MNRWFRAAILLIPTIAFVQACGGTASDSTAGNTNWLKRCDEQRDCGDGLSCVCNSCQETCSENADCDLAGPGSRCAIASDEMRCSDAPAEARLCVKNCDVNADCERDDLLCGDGACVSRGRIDAGLHVDGSAVGDASGSLPPVVSKPGDATMYEDVIDVPVIEVDGGGPAQVLESGTGYGIAYVLDNELIAYFDSSATFDSDGNMTAYSDSADEGLSIGNATFGDGDTNGVVAWGSWLGGPMVGMRFGNPYSVTAPSSTGFHYAVAKIASILPTGIVAYELVGNSTPTVTGSGISVLEYATIVVDYDLGHVGIEISVTTDWGPITFETTGGITNVSGAEGVLNNKLFRIDDNVDGVLDLRGVIADDGDALAVAYVARHHVSPSDGGSQFSYSADVNGSMAFRRK